MCVRRKFGGVRLAGLAVVLVSSAFAQNPGALRPWDEYHAIMWVGDTAYKRPEKLPLFFQRLRDMGVNTAMVYSEGDPQPLLQAKMPYYVENLINRGLCLKFNSKVTDWDKFVTEWAQSGRPESSLVRDFCLDDPQWQAWARKQMQLTVRKNFEHQPLAYNIRDELSTTISANPFDYDFGPMALNQFREWLKTQYPNLTALNQEWDTRFNSWDEVRPFTTDQIKNRMASGQALPRGQPDWQTLESLKFNPATARQKPLPWNFSPWADFRTYMDWSLARALEQLRRAAHEIDPHTPVGIEGTQMPDAFGGYDLYRLSQVLDWVEPYDIGNAREIFGSFMPGKPILTTLFEPDTDHARRRLWHLLLEGDRGCLVWWSEDSIDWQSEDYQLTPKARAIAIALKEMTSPLARLFLRAQPERDAVFIHYSQPSIQIDWLLESTVDGSTWLRRFSSFEAEHNLQAKVRNAWVKAFQDLGYSPQFVSSEQIEQGRLRQATNAILVLPTSWALSDKEIAEIDRWAGSGPSGSNVIFFDGSPAVFDEHGRLRVQGAPPPFNSTGEPAGCTARGASSARWQGKPAAYLRDRLSPQGSSSFTDWIQSQANFQPEVSVPVNARVRIRRFRAGQAQLIACERNIDYHMSEDLKEAGGNGTLEKPIEVRATLRTPRHVYDLRHRKYLGLTRELRFDLDPWQPALFGIANDRQTVENLLP